MKFLKKKKKIAVDWKDGAILFFSRPLYTEIAEEWYEYAIDHTISERQPEIYGWKLITAALVGWENITVGDTDLPLPFTKENKIEIINTLATDIEMIKKIQVAMKSETENLMSGSTAQQNTDGSQNAA